MHHLLFIFGHIHKIIKHLQHTKYINMVPHSISKAQNTEQKILQNKAQQEQGANSIAEAPKLLKPRLITQLMQR